MAMSEQIGIHSRTGESLALKGVDARARLAGLLATTKLVQRYENTTPTPLELAYTFPLPFDAVLLNFSVCIGERRYLGEVVPSRLAEEQYEHAVESGNSAFRLQSIGEGLYSATLGNVLPGEVVRIELEYAEPLSWNGLSMRYRLPTTLAPRYGEPRELQPWQQPISSLDAQYSLTLSVELMGELAKATVACPSHRIRLAAAQGQLTVSLANDAEMDRDFILDIQSDGLESLGVAASALDTHVAMLTLMPPAVDAEASRDTVILLDCSGSMAGDSIRLAKEGVQLAIGHFTPEDRFGLIGFGSDFTCFAPSLQSARAQTMQQARAFVSALKSMGGTELASALEAALAYKSGRPLDLLVLTDGEVWKLENVTEHAKAIGARIFTVGIGSAVAEDTVRMLADETGGACELVSPNEDMSARIERHFKRMRQPRISDVTFEWPTPPLWTTTPPRAVFAGDAYSVFAAFPSQISGSVRAQIHFAGAEEAQSMAVRIDGAGAMNTQIVRVAAASRLQSLADDSRSAWAVRYQLVTDDTDYIVTLERSEAERPTELPELHVVPHMLAAGWSGSGTVVKCSPQRSYSNSESIQSMKTLSANICYSVRPDADVPAVMRSTRRAAIHPAAQDDGPLAGFIARLQRRLERRALGGLPTSREELITTQLPNALVMLIDQARAKGLDELAIARALYAALIDCGLGHTLGDRFTDQVKGLLNSGALDNSLVQDFKRVLDTIGQAGAGSFSSGRLDIQTF